MSRHHHIPVEWKYHVVKLGNLEDAAAYLDGASIHEIAKEVVVLTKSIIRPQEVNLTDFIGGDAGLKRIGMRISIQSSVAGGVLSAILHRECIYFKFFLAEKSALSWIATPPSLVISDSMTNFTELVRYYMEQNEIACL